MVDASRNAIIRRVPATDGGLHVTDCPGDEPALVLMHGFPDDCRIYNRLILWLLGHTARQFGADPLDPDSVGITAIVPQFFGDEGHRDALPAIRAWTAALFSGLYAQDGRIARGELAALDPPVALVFGALDRYLSPDLAAHLAGLFPKAVLHLIDGASHWPQWDQPHAVSELIRCAP
jgi:haloalkane dehalogenase